MQATTIYRSIILDWKKRGTAEASQASAAASNERSMHLTGFLVNRLHFAPSYVRFFCQQNC